MMRKPVVFDDVASLDGNSMERFLKAVDGNAFACALKGAGDEVRTHVYQHMSTRAAALLKEDIELGPTRANEVAQAQRQIVDLLRTLEEAGQIKIARPNR